MRTITIILVFLALLLLLTVSRCRLLALGISQLLEIRGATNVTVQVSRLSLHSVRLETIAFSLPLAGDRLGVRLHGLTATYDTTTLRAGRMDTITIDSLALRLPHQSAVSSPPSPGLPSSLADTAWLEQIPLHRLTIRRLRLAGARADVLAGKELSLALTREDGTLRGTLALLESGNTPLRLQAELSRESRLNLRLVDDLQPAPSSHLSLYPSGNGGLAGEFSIRLALVSRLAGLLARSIPRLSGTVSGKGFLAAGDRASFSLSINADGAGTPTLQTKKISLRLEGVLQAHAGKIILGNGSRLSLTGLTTPRFAVATADMDLAGSCEQRATALVIEPAAEQQWTVSGIAAAGIHCERMEIRPGLSLTLEPEQAAVTLADTFRLQAVNLVGGTFRLAGLQLAPREQTGIMLHRDHWRVRPGDWLLEPRTTSTRGITLRWQPVTVTLQGMEGGDGRWSARGTLRSRGLLLSGHGQRVPLSDLLLHIKADSGQIQGRAAFSIGNLPGRMETVFQHEAATASGRAELHTSSPVRFSRDHPLASLVPDLPLDLDQGSLTLSAAASWSRDRPPMLQADVALTGGGGRIGEITFSGLAITERIQVLPRLKSLVPATITLKNLDTGVRANDVEARIALEPSSAGRRPALRIQRFAARLFGGRITASGLVLDPNRPDGRCTIVLHGIDLAEIIRLMQVKDLRVSGLVDGSLPVHLSREGVSIRNGELHNRPPGGVIRYTPAHKNGLAGMELTAYALKAMEDFRYNLLTARVEYRPDGQLDVALHMEGHSPKLETTRPVHLNINTEQNLLSLLKSLRYSRSLTDELDRSIQHHYSPAPGTTPPGR